MSRLMIYIWTYLVGVRIFLFNSNRNDLVSIKECVVKTIQGHSITFNFYEKVQTNSIVRFNKVFTKNIKYYVIEAIFSDGFDDNFKKYNEVKYYIDFNSHGLFEIDLVLDVLLNKFVMYLENAFLNKRGI